MRILTVGNMYPPHHLGGYELMWRSSVGHLRGRGHDVRVLTTTFRRDDVEAEDEPDVHRELRWYWRDHEFPRLPLRERLRLERANLTALERHLRGSRADVVCWWAMGGMSMALLEAMRRRGMPALGVVVDDWLVYGPAVDGWQRFARRLGPLAAVLERRSGVPSRFRLDRTARWLFVSERVRGRAAREGHDVGGAAIAHGGIDPVLFGRAEPRDWQWRLLYLGRIDPRKGIDTAVAALGELPEANLTIVGDGDRAYLAELRALVARNGLTKRVSFERHERSRLAEVYAAHDAVLFPVRWAEPWGLVPLEAMSVGRPVVATGTGGSAEYLRDGENCLLFPKGDAGALGDAVKRLAADRQLRERLTSGGHETAARFTEAGFNAAVAAALEALS